MTPERLFQLRIEIHSWPKGEQRDIAQELIDDLERTANALQEADHELWQLITRKNTRYTPDARQMEDQKKHACGMNQGAKK